jgi:hypothetical protein
MLEIEIVQKTSHITTEPQSLIVNFYDLFIYFSVLIPQYKNM